jgi:hypothetical protein
VSFEVETGAEHFHPESFYSSENVNDGDPFRQSNLNLKYKQLKDVTFTNALIGMKKSD